MANAVVLLVARVVAGTTGRSMRNADILLFVVVGGAVLLRPAGPGVLATATLGLAATIGWHRHRRGNHVAATAFYAAAAVAAGFLADDLGWLNGDGLAVLWMGVIGGVISLLGPGNVATPTDRAGGVIAPHRVRAARFVTLAAAVAVSLTHQPAAMAPAWAALIAAATRP
jgi:hypothetical protein